MSQLKGKRKAVIIEELNGMLRVFRRAGLCQNALAMNAEGDTVRPWQKSAVAFCVVGAHVRATGIVEYDTVESFRALDEIQRTVTDAPPFFRQAPTELIGWNNQPGRTKQEVTAAIRSTIRRLGGEVK